MNSLFYVIQFGGIILAVIIAIIIYKDKAKFGEAAWQASGQNNTLWVVLGFFLGIIGLAIYWFAIRPKVEAAAQQIQYGGYPTGPGAPGQYGGY